MALTLLPVIRLLRIVTGPVQLLIPPPSASLATSDRPDATPTRFLLTVVLTSVNVPHESMPPPEARANGHGPSGQGGPTGAVDDGATRLSVLTVFRMVTVAPPEWSAFGGISMPPPRATTPSCPSEAAAADGASTASAAIMAVTANSLFVGCMF
jgi:hypothetical protein